MSQSQPTLLGYDGCSHRGGKVVDDNHCVRGMLFQIFFEGGHDLTCQLVQVLAVNTQKDIWPRHL